MKSQLRQEFEETERKKRCCASCETVTQYMVSESIKKPTAFKIGIFTVFIVVMFITMLKSVVDSSPILFVKIGQDSVGAIDFTMRSRSSSASLMPGDLNYYAINPEMGMYGYNPEGAGVDPE